MKEQTGVHSEGITVETSVSCRYVGQNYEQEVRTYSGHLDRSFELAISMDPNDPSFRESLAKAFHESHHRAYGYALEDQPIESVYLGATALIKGHPVRPQPYNGEGNKGTRQVCVDDGTWVETDILDRNALKPGDRYSGPVVVMEPTSTTYVPAGFTMVVDEAFCLILSKGQ